MYDQLVRNLTVNYSLISYNSIRLEIGLVSFQYLHLGANNLTGSVSDDLARQFYRT